ncbi:MAG: hypothetical protein IPJ36_17235 [Simplicispira sp.]|nr:hypothetical protein [Simplicispira sp.]
MNARPVRCRHSRAKLWGALDKAKRIAEQSKSRKNTTGKPSSTHGPEVECIARGKSRTPYEFGVKVGIAMTLKHNLIVGARAFPAKPTTGTHSGSNWSRPAS